MPACLVFVAWVALAQASAPTGEVRGRVTDQDGLAVNGAAVFLINLASEGRLTFTGNGGHFTFTGVAPGTYRVAAQLDGFIPAQRITVQVMAGTATDVVVLQLMVRPYGETVVVTGSRKDELVRYAPAAISVQ